MNRKTCALCGIALTKNNSSKHHLTPLSTVPTKKFLSAQREYPMHSFRDVKHRKTVAIHRVCHALIHALYTNEQLALHFHTLDLLLTSSRIKGWIRFIHDEPARLEQEDIVEKFKNRLL